MNNSNFVSLTEWAKRQYGDAAPHINTLRAWIRNGRIQPQPKKQGRAYYLKPEAEYK